MNEATKPDTLTAALERIDVAVWAKKTLRECLAIAARSARGRSKVEVDPVRVDAVLAAVVQRIEVERAAIAKPKPAD